MSALGKHTLDISYFLFALWAGPNFDDQQFRDANGYSDLVKGMVVFPFHSVNEPL